LAKVDPELIHRRLFEWSTLGYIPKLGSDAEATTEKFRVNELLAHAEALMIRKDTAAALELLISAREVSPNHSDVKLRIVQCALGAGEFAICRDTLDDLKSNGHRSAMLDYLSGHLAFAEGDIARGEDIFDPLEIAIKGKPQMQNMICGIGDARLKAGLTDKAKQSFQRALNIQPKSVPALNGLGSVHLQELQFENAEAAFSASLKLVASQPIIVTKRGYALMGLHEIAQAEAAFQAALAIDPTSTYANDGLAKLRHLVAKTTLKPKTQRTAS